jgi:toxin FitB
VSPGCPPAAGRRKTELAAAGRGLLGEEFRDRVLPFGEHCAWRYADIACGRETLGRPIGVADAQIAAICRTAGATLATRNTDDFSGTGIELINPWKLDRPEPA